MTTPALTLASQNWQAGSSACAAREAPAVCHCPGADEAEGPGGCCCGQGAPCQVNSAPPLAHDEFLPSQAPQPHPSALAAQRPAGTWVASWLPRAFSAAEPPWRPPKPLYLRNASLLI